MGRGAIVFLVLAWWLIGRCGQLTEQTAARDNESGRTAAVLVMGASVASLAAVAFTLRIRQWSPASRAGRSCTGLMGLPGFPRPS
jgi:hypothetical protein